MRLELEQNHSSTTFAEDATVESSLENKAAEAAEHLREGIRAAQSGNRAAARAALLRAAELDPLSESTWLWLSSISEYPEELLVFLTNVLEINPLNARALEWSAATRSLLAKNFVQRGIDAAEAHQNDTAAQHFNQALEYDERNSMAWLWLASLSESNEGKLTYLEKVLEFDPENESAKAGYQAAKNSIRTSLLAEARSAAVAGKSAEAEELLDAIIAEEPDAEDAWVLRSHLANGFDAKIASFRRILEINPNNAGAKAGLESLTSIMDAVAATEPAPVEVAKETVVNVETEPVTENASFAPPFDSFAEESHKDFDEEVSEAFTALTSVVDTDAESEFETAAPFVEPTPATEETVAEFESTEAVHETQSQQDEITHELVPEETTAVATEQPVQENESEAPASSETPEPTLDDAPAISAPTINPFEADSFQKERDEFATVASADVDPEMLAEVQNYDFKTPNLGNGNGTGHAFDAPFDATMYGGGKIPMPVGDFDQADIFANTGFETRLFVDQVGDDAQSVSATAACPFCNTDNDVQAIACQGCLSVLTLADLELILANHHADKAMLRPAVDKMETEKALREFNEAELTTLGIGHLNLRNLQYGYNCLQEASQKNPNNVVLSGQVNALLIRLDEIRQQDEAHESMSKGKTILVVDDSPTVRKLIAGKLEKCGHQVVCSSDGVEAMVQLEGMRPDLVLLDITMPRMDGYQVCKLIRGNPATKDVPVVMISGKDGFFDKVRGRMAGTSGYITKPFGPETLMKAVESYLKTEHAVEIA